MCDNTFSFKLNQVIYRQHVKAHPTLPKGNSISRFYANGFHWSGVLWETEFHLLWRCTSLTYKPEKVLTFLRLLRPLFKFHIVGTTNVLF